MILVAPSLPENVGMAARALRTFGGGELVLVGGVSPGHPQAVAAAAGASRVLEAARQVRTLAEAIAGSPLAIGTTARAYDRPDLRAIPVREAASRAPAGAAWVFGTERHGLTREQLHTCHLVARIPSAGPSLNLAQAVAICLYEASIPISGPAPAGRPAAALLGDAARVAAILEDLGVATGRDAPSKAHTLLRLSAGLMLDPDEAALLGAVIAKITIRH